MNVIETRALGKSYGSKIAVDHFDMQVKQGDIYGFIGHNGAGKSTVMKMIAGLARPTSGEVRLFGGQGKEEGAQARIGILIESAGLYPTMGAYENLMLKATAMGIPDAKQKSLRMIEVVGLRSAAKLRTKKYSMGMKQRLGLALALIGDPDILLLDEPLNGLDPEGAREIRELLQQLNEQRGVTMLVSSHVIEQLGKMANRYGVIRNGSMVREVTRAEVEQECQDCISVRVADPSVALAFLEEEFPQARFQVLPDGSLNIMGIADASSVGDALGRRDIAVHGLQVHRRDLEDYFVDLMGAENHD